MLQPGQSVPAKHEDDGAQHRRQLRQVRTPEQDVKAKPAQKHVERYDQGEPVDVMRVPQNHQGHQQGRKQEHLGVGQGGMTAEQVGIPKGRIALLDRHRGERGSGKILSQGIIGDHPQATQQRRVTGRPSQNHETESGVPETERLHEIRPPGFILSVLFQTHLLPGMDEEFETGRGAFDYSSDGSSDSSSDGSSGKRPTRSPGKRDRPLSSPEIP